MQDELLKIFFTQQIARDCLRDMAQCEPLGQKDTYHIIEAHNKMSEAISHLRMVIPQESIKEVNNELNEILNEIYVDNKTHLK